MSQFNWTFPGGKPKQEVTSITLVNNTAKTQDVTVPAGKRWLLLNLKVTNIDDVVRNIDVLIYKEAGKTNVLRMLVSEDAVLANGAELVQWPSYRVDTDDHMQASSGYPVILSAGNTISITWATGGASTGATDADGLVVEYLEIDLP